MTQHYQFGRPGVTSISVDGIEHKVNPATGFLEVNVMTPNLMRQLERRNAVQVDPAHPPAKPGNPTPASGTGAATASGDANPPVPGTTTPSIPGTAAELVPPRGSAAAETGGPPVTVQAGALSPTDEEERQALFIELDTAMGSRIDRRRSLQQLRQMKADLAK